MGKVEHRRIGGGVVTGASAGGGAGDCAPSPSRVPAWGRSLGAWKVWRQPGRKRWQQEARPSYCPTDVADPDAGERAAQTVEDELGPIDVWVNNAMTGVFAPFIEIGPEEFRRVTEVTYLGYVYGTRAALARMLPRDRGVIVQVGSALTYRAIPLQSAYCGAKHALKGSLSRYEPSYSTAEAGWP